MTIREVLDADWTVDRIDVTVRDAETSKYIMRYCIGRDVKPGRSEPFAYATEIGDMHGNDQMKSLYIRRIIQYRQKEKKPQGKEMGVGVLFEEIPNEILDLTIWHMYPYHCGGSDNMHGYKFDCYVDMWGGIPGECQQLTIDD